MGIEGYIPQIWVRLVNVPALLIQQALAARTYIGCRQCLAPAQSLLQGNIPLPAIGKLKVRGKRKCIRATVGRAAGGRYVELRRRDRQRLAGKMNRVCETETAE